jgi:CheY-like chemotaxis protein
MPKCGYELYDELKKIDNKIKVCFMTATYQNYEGLRAAFPMVEMECYIQKPVEIKDLIRRSSSRRVKAIVNQFPLEPIISHNNNGITGR